MNEPPVAALPRRAVAALFHRAALAVFGGAGLAAVVAAPVRAGSSGKKPRKKCKKRVGDCRETWQGICAGNSGCLADFPACCPRLENCNVTRYLECIFSFSSRQGARWS